MKISPSQKRFYVTVMASLLAFSLRDIFAQDLGELARQERARKLARQTRVTKVFTNEDLNREVIISPEERAALEAQATENAATLAENAPAPATEPAGQPVPIHLTLRQPAMPSKEIPAPAKSFAERAVPTVPLWPAGMPLGDIARYYRQQIDPQIPADNNRDIADALAHAPLARDFASDKLRMTLAPVASEATAPAPAVAQPVRRALTDINLPAPFVMAGTDGSRVPVIENIADPAVPGFPSPASRLELAAATPAAPARPRTEGLRFEAPNMSEVVLSFGSDAALGIPSLTGEESAIPMYDSSRDPLTIRFRAPEPTPAPAAARTPLARTVEVAEPQLRAIITSTGTSTSALETVSAWRYADELPAAPPAAVQHDTALQATSLSAEDSATVAGNELQQVRVERGDSLWKLAQRHMGDGRAWRQIAAVNPQMANPNQIRAGEMLVIPAAGSSVETATATHRSKPVIASTSAGKTVTVRKGDSLWKLAESALGNGAAWSCIAESNPQITNADHILAGQTLVMPTNCNTQS